MREKTTTASDRYFDALSSLDSVAYLACFSVDAELLDPYGGHALLGHDGLRKWFKGMEVTWQEFSMAPLESFQSGDRVAVRWRASGTAKSGKSASFSGINVFTVNEDSLITRLEGYWDAARMMEQIA